MNDSLAGSERVRCRNSKCRSKLPAPTSNDHKAFCTPYCHTQFYKRKCLVCEKPLPEGHRRQLCSARKCRLDYRNFRPAYVLESGPGLPPEPKCKSDAKSPCKTGTFFRIGEGPEWSWDDTKVEHEHWLYAYGRVVAIICGPDHPLVIDAQPVGEWTIRYPFVFPAQTATTLEAARKLALHVALWTWPIGGIKPKPTPREKITEAERRAGDLADEKYVAEDEERLRALVGT
jgi:hypothetical protein